MIFSMVGSTGKAGFKRPQIKKAKTALISVENKRKCKHEKAVYALKKAPQSFEYWALKLF